MSQPAVNLAPLFVSTDELRFGWHRTVANLKPWLWLGAGSLFLSLVQRQLTYPNGRAPLLALCLQLLQVGVTLAALRVALRVADGQPAGELAPKVLLAGYFPFLLTQMLFGLIVAGGLLLLVVPGVWWALTYGFAPLLNASAGLAPVEALRESRRLTAGHRGALLGFGLLCIGVNMLGLLALGVGLCVTMPTTMIASVDVLRRLQAQRPRTLVVQPPATAPLAAGPHLPAA